MTPAFIRLLSSLTGSGTVHCLRTGDKGAQKLATYMCALSSNSQARTGRLGTGAPPRFPDISILRQDVKLGRLVLTACAIHDMIRVVEGYFMRGKC